jgi:hypothetical protein
MRSETLGNLDGTPPDQIALVTRGKWAGLVGWVNGTNGAFLENQLPKTIHEPLRREFETCQAATAAL